MKVSIYTSYPRESFIYFYLFSICNEMSRLFIILLIIGAIIFTNQDVIESDYSHGRRRGYFRRRLRHRDVYPMQHHYRPRRRYWYSFASDWYHHLPCMAGCVNLGNDGWGCQYPGNGVNQCVFSRDCRGC